MNRWTRDLPGTAARGVLIQDNDRADGLQSRPTHTPPGTAVSVPHPGFVYRMEYMNRIKEAHIDNVADFWSRQGLKGDIDAKRLALKALIIGMALSRDVEEWGRTMFGLSLGEMTALTAVRRASPGMLRPTDLFVSTSMSSAGMTKQLNGLERRGLVERLDDPHRKRGFLIKLTPAGRVMADAIHTGIDSSSSITSALAGLPQTRRNQVEQTLDLLLEAHRQSALIRKARSPKGGAPGQASF